MTEKILIISYNDKLIEIVRELDDFEVFIVDSPDDKLWVSNPAYYEQVQIHINKYIPKRKDLFPASDYDYVLIDVQLEWLLEFKVQDLFEWHKRIILVGESNSQILDDWAVFYDVDFLIFPFTPKQLEQRLRVNKVFSDCPRETALNLWMI